MAQENENFVPLKVGDVCEYFYLLLSGPVSYKCVVEKVFDDGITYYLKEIPFKGECRDALFTDNIEHVRTFEHDYGDGEIFHGYRGIRNIIRKKGED